MNLKMKSHKQTIPNITPKKTDELVGLAKFRMGERISSMISESKINMHQMVRFLPVAKYCQNKREEMSLSIKDISSKINVPQYQLKAIEGASVSEIRYVMLKKYVEFLDIDKEFEKWAQQNSDIIEEIGENSSV